MRSHLCVFLNAMSTHFFGTFSPIVHTHAIANAYFHLWKTHTFKNAVQNRDFWNEALSKDGENAGFRERNEKDHIRTIDENA